MKKLLVFLTLALSGFLVWTAFALWAGLYSIYSSPPTRQDPDGATLLVSREEGEPLFNSPDYVPPTQKMESMPGSIRFGPAKRAVRPLDKRIIVTLPYFEWAYKKSLEKEEAATE